jgi:hypothetical protein
MSIGLGIFVLSLLIGINCLYAFTRRSRGRFEQPIDLALKGDKEGLFKWCCNRCYQAFSVIYEYEETKVGSFWSLDDRYYEHGIKILYERFCYAMAIVVDQFHSECVALYDANDVRFKSLDDAQRKTTTFEVYLSRSVDEVFKHGCRDLDWNDTTFKYYHDVDYLDDELCEEYEKYWKRHRAMLSDVTAVRNTFSSGERIYLYGFPSLDYDDDVDKTWNLDCLHMMRVCRISGDSDVEKYLVDTKRHYLPTIIKAFMTTPKTDVFSAKPEAKRR